MPPAILASARARPRPLVLARRVSPDAPRAAPRLPARLPARRPVEPIAVRGAPLVRVDGVRGVRRRGSRIVSRAASAGGLWRLWPFAHAWAVDAPTIEADAAGDSPGADQQQQQQLRGDATNPWRTVALVLGAMLVAALVHPPLASASSTLIAAVAANVVAPVGVLYPAATYIAAGAQAWANNAVGVVGTLVSSAASAGAGYAAASARERAEMEELRAEIAGIREAAAAVGNPAVGISAAVGMSVSNTRPAIAEETRGAVVPTEDPVVAAERASAEAELADLRRQLARLRAVWTPDVDDEDDDEGDEGDDEGDEGDDAGEWGVAGDAEGVSKRDGGDGVTRVSSTAAAAGSVDARAAGVSDWRATAKSRAAWSPSVDDDDAEAAASSPASSSSSSSSSSFHSSSAIDEEEAARIAAEIVALRAELAGVRGVGASSGAVPGAGSGDFGGVRSVAEASGPVDWAALAKSRALWSPSDDGDAGSARGESRASAVDGFGETGERARLLEEDVAWRRRLGMTENAQNDQPLGH